MLCVWVIVDVFDGVGFVMMISDNIVGMMWDKLLVNVVMGVLMGFMGFIYGQFYDELLFKVMLFVVVVEVIVVVWVVGVKLLMIDFEQVWMLVVEGLFVIFKILML